MPRRVEMELRGRVSRLFGNLGLKILALLLATACWFFIASGREAYRELAVPLEIAGIPEGFAVDGSYPPKVSIRVSGKGRDLFRARANDFKVVVNLAGKDPGVYRVDVTPGDVIYAGPGDVRVEDILSEKIIMLELERRITKGVPVKVEFSGSLAPGFYFGLPEVRPPKATLYGSAGVLDKVNAVTVAVDAADRDATFTAEAAIKAPAGITLVGSDEVAVTVPVGRGERRTFAGVPVAAKSSGPVKYQPAPAEVNVTFEGEAGRLAALAPPAASVTSGAPGRYPVAVDVPDYVTLVSVFPAEVQVTAVQAP